MKLIKERKINKYVLIALLYLSFCFANWYNAICTAESIRVIYPMYALIVNWFTALLFGGIFPLIIYLLAVRFLMRMLKRTPYLPLGAMEYALPYFYIGANIIIGLFNILYYYVPIASIWGNIIVPIVVTACFFAWFMVYICKTYVKNYNWRVMAIYFGRIYIVIATAITVFGIVAEVIA